ncbi:DUF1002 domain-containing protein [Ammoniphilus resinae]|uniref:Uncharacterized protein YpuA (DUF1002 family) n=1 Tax=Ammoniphilus resinae TaxID=861532 RepID=A0ABS4GXQ6_9BACL|nr:DUF1002 domain-containing protein [Ammoniphilus resinae]MBP1935058.1 uncharacterized protein YpuA (DUF1002 family) [Ammoniphilus resinae]
MWKKGMLLVLILCFSLGSFASADQIIEKPIVTLGKDLTKAQADQMLQHFGHPQAEIIYITNQEEHHALADLLPAKVIGNKAISSSMITLKDAGYGIQVATDNISWVTDQMYAQALATAGIENAEVKVAAPFPVSGTAALTGIMKAFETVSDEKISEEQKQTATEEMVLTAKLAEEKGNDQQVVELMKQLKAQLAENKLSEEQLAQVIDNLAAQSGLNLTPEEKDALISLAIKIQNLNINWDSVVVQGQQLLDGAKDYLDANPEAKSWFGSLWEKLKMWIDSFFK